MTPREAFELAAFIGHLTGAEFDRRVNEGMKDYNTAKNIPTELIYPILCRDREYLDNTHFTYQLYSGLIESLRQSQGKSIKNL